MMLSMIVFTGVNSEIAILDYLAEHTCSLLSLQIQVAVEAFPHHKYTYAQLRDSV